MRESLKEIIDKNLISCVPAHSQQHSQQEIKYKLKHHAQLRNAKFISNDIDGGDFLVGWTNMSAERLYTHWTQVRNYNDNRL